jgi:methylglutaconyl-CoA hydratase
MTPIVLTDLSAPAIAAITMNRPDKRNALSLALITGLTDAFAAAAEDRYRRAIVLRGAGKSFCAGLDLEEMNQAGNAEKAATALSKLYETMANSPCVTIAAAHGAAFGGGVGLIAASDIVIAAEDLKVGFPEVKRGLTAALITSLLRRSVADRQLRELIVLGRTIDAKTAAAMNIVNTVVAASDLDAAVQRYCREVIAAAPNAIARSKKLLDELAIRSASEDLKLALEFHFSGKHEGELKEGIAAFMEKREPKWGPRDQ